jgi:hypothetical protein
VPSCFVDYLIEIIFPVNVSFKELKEDRLFIEEALQQIAGTLKGWGWDRRTHMDQHYLLFKKSRERSYKRLSFAANII